MLASDTLRLRFLFPFHVLFLLPFEKCQSNFSLTAFLIIYPRIHTHSCTWRLGIKRARTELPNDITWFNVSPWLNSTRWYANCIRTRIPRVPIIALFECDRFAVVKNQFCRIIPDLSSLETIEIVKFARINQKSQTKQASYQWLQIGARRKIHQSNLTASALKFMNFTTWKIYRLNIFKISP